MFSLVITIISIALVAALALATLYWGGQSFLKGSSRAEAGQLLVQGQQLLAASDLYFTEHGTWPASLDDLVDGKYLQSKPVAAAGAAPDAAAQWRMVSAGAPVFAVDFNAKDDVCKQVNALALKTETVFPAPYDGAQVQCYGAAGAAMTTVVAKTPAHLREAVPTTVPGLPAAAPATGGSELSLSSASYAFAPTVINATRSVVAASITNGTAAAVDLLDVWADDGSNFWGYYGDDCLALGSRLQPGQSCSLVVDFYPFEIGTFSDTVTASTSAGGKSIAITGSGIDGPSFGIDYSGVIFQPTSSSLPGVAFVVTPAIGASVSQDITITNTGSQAAPTPAIGSFWDWPSGSSTDTSAFNAQRAGVSVLNNCPTTLAAAASCTLTVTAAPTAPGRWQNMLFDITLPGGEVLLTENVTLDTAESGAYSVTAAGYPNMGTTYSTNLGTLALNTTLEISATLTNTTSYSAQLRFQADGGTAATATLDASACPDVLSSGASCTVKHFITPTVAGQSGGAGFNYYFNNKPVRWSTFTFITGS